MNTVATHLHRRERQINRALLSEARRLEPENGGKMLLAVDDTVSALFGALRALHEAGVSVDITRLDRNTHALKQETSLETGSLNENIARTYKLINNVAQAAQHEQVTNRQLQSELMAPFVERVTGAANKLGKIYMHSVTPGKRATPEVAHQVDETFCEFFDALHHFMSHAEEKLPQQESATSPTLPAFTSPLALRFMERPKRGTEGSRIDRLMPQLTTENGALLLRAVDELACHQAQLLLDCVSEGVATSYEKGNPARGSASEIARKSALPAMGTDIMPTRWPPT